jgi:hypothetical protein
MFRFCGLSVRGNLFHEGHKAFNLHACQATKQQLSRICQVYFRNGKDIFCIPLLLVVNDHHMNGFPTTHKVELSQTVCHTNGIATGGFDRKVALVEAIVFRR